MSDLFTANAGVGPSGEMRYTDKTTGGILFEIGPGGLPRYKKVTVTPTQMIALGTSPVAPVTIVAAPPTGMAHYIHGAVIYLNFGTTPFSGGSAVTFTMNGITIFSTTAALINGGSAVLIQPAFPGLGTSASLGAINAALIMNATAAFAAGDSPVDVHVWYSTILIP